jgi:PBS lyase HEAT-like repeat
MKKNNPTIIVFGIVLIIFLSFFLIKPTSHQPTLILPKFDGLGTNAVPVLIEFLTTNKFRAQQNVTNKTRVSYRSFRVLQSAMQALGGMGTNAESAVPILMEYLKEGDARGQGSAAEALASVGRNQLDAIIPVLINTLTNSSPVHNRGGIAGGMALLGTNYADVFLPIMVGVINDNSPTPQIEGQWLELWLL